MSSLAEKIKQAARRNHELLAALRDTDHARSELERQDRYVAELGNDIAASRKHVEELDKKRQKELKEHESYRDSVVKRLAYNAAGKKERFEEKAKKEESEYLAALKEEHDAQAMLRGREEALTEAKAAREEMRARVQRRDAAQRELDQLYESIFQGRSPGFPEEDEAEAGRRRAAERRDAAKSRAEAQNKAVHLLVEGMKKMNEASGCMEEALSYSKMDMWGGGTTTDMMERRALGKASVLSTEARLSASQASRLDGEVGMVPEVHVPQGDLMTDVFFDNVFTDMAFHEKIKKGAEEMERARLALKGELDRARERAGNLWQELEQRQVELESARLQLQKTREKAFEKIARASEEEDGKGEGNGAFGNGDEKPSNNPFF